MKSALGLLVFGVLALWVRGVFAGVLPSGVGPEVGLLVAVGLGLHLPGTLGLVLAALFGVFTDVLTGALLGHHPILFLLAFAVTRVAGAQLDLRRGLPVLVLVAALSVAHALLTFALSRLFGAPAPFPGFERLIGQGVLDALCSVLVLPLMAGLVRSLSEEDRRAVELSPRRREV